MSTKAGIPSRTSLTIAATLFSLLAATGGFSQQISDALRVARPGLHFNARALGLGNAYSTIGYDFSALCFNPATMAVSPKTSYSMTMNSNAFESSSNYYGANVNFTTSNSTLSQMGVTLPFRLDSTRHAVLGLGFTQSKDFNLGYKYEGLNAGSRSFIQALADNADPIAKALGLSYPTYEASGRYLGDQTILGPNMYETGYLLDEGALFHLSIGASVEAAHNVFFGVSASRNTSAYVSDVELSASDVNDVYPVGVQTIPGNLQTEGFAGADYRIVRDVQYSGWELRFGVLYKLENFVAVSASFKLPTSHKVNEDNFISGGSQFISNRSFVVPETEFLSFYSFMPPPEATLGGMINLWMLTGTAEARFVDYASMKITAGAGQIPDRMRISKRIKEELNGAVNFNAGVELRPPFTGLSIRAGAIYQPSPYKGEPARNSQKFLTAGFGINANIMELDLGYAYGWRGENKNQQTGSASAAEQTITYQTVLFTMRFLP